MFVTKGSKPPKTSRRTARITAVNKAAHEKANDAKAADEAAIRKDAIYEQKIAAWKRSIQAKADAKKAKEVQQPAKTVEGVKVVKKAAHEKANDAKAAEEAATKKAALEEATNKDLLEEGPLKKGPLECPSEKGPLETQVIRPSDQVCIRDLEVGPIIEPIKEPPHGRNDDL